MGGHPHCNRWRCGIEQDALERQPGSHQSRRDRHAVDRHEHRAGGRTEDYRARERETSEIEKLADTVGILSTADPLINVKATSAHHSIGGSSAHNSAIEFARTTHPASRTNETYGRALELVARRELDADAFVVGVF